MTRVEDLSEEESVKRVEEWAKELEVSHRQDSTTDPARPSSDEGA
jgi:hypothetical protein